jgi:FkbM family methyltransferase
MVRPGLYAKRAYAEILRIRVLAMSPAVNLAEEFWFARYRPVEGDVIVDIGAGVGEDLETYLEAVGPTGRIIMIESDLDSFKALAEACKGYANVFCSRVAAADSQRLMWCKKGATYEENSVADERASDEEIGVQAIPLDLHLLEHVGVDRIDLLKMNIEGAERMALPGMVATLELARNAVIAAHDFRADRGDGEQFRTRAEVVAAMEAAGFTTEVSAEYHVYGWR